MMITTLNKFMHHFLLALLTCGVACQAGCSSLALPKPAGWKSRSDRTEVPTRVVVVWTDTIMNQPGQRGVRGVGGRLLFYAGQERSPVQVSGKLTIYAYDDTEADNAYNDTEADWQETEADAAPARKFVFLPEQLASHQSTSTVGSSYNVWLPWNEVGNPARQLTLIARFEPEQGAVVLSDPARQLLPGVSVAKKAKKSTVETAAYYDQPHSSQLDRASYESAPVAGAAGGAAAGAADPLETFTIDLPTDVARRWHAEVDRSLKNSPPRHATSRPAASALPTAPGQESANEHAPLAPLRRVESALAEPRPRRRLSAREIPSRIIRRPASRRAASAAPTEQQ